MNALYKVLVDLKNIRTLEAVGTKFFANYYFIHAVRKPAAMAKFATTSRGTMSEYELLSPSRQLRSPDPVAAIIAEIPFRRSTNPASGSFQDAQTT